MSRPDQTAPLPIHTLPVYCADMFCVSHGVNQGDPIGAAQDLVHEDIYELNQAGVQKHISMTIDEDTGALAIGENSELGQTGAPLYLDCLVTLMGPHATTEEALVLVETDSATGMVAQVYLHTLTPIMPKTGYTLVTVDQAGARAKLAESACVSFTHDTNITMADGRQVPVQALRVGDRVLTKDSGPQKVRWIGQQTVRASGAFAPIVIAAGALNNVNQLTVSPNHRLFIYQRVDTIGAGQKEILVKACNLVNGTSVVSAEGGFVEYFQLLFDKHEIIFAEGIAAESLFIDTKTRPVVPAKVQESLKLNARPVQSGRELGPRDLASQDAVDILRRASAL